MADLGLLHYLRQLFVLEQLLASSRSNKKHLFQSIVISREKESSFLLLDKAITFFTDISRKSKTEVTLK